MQETRSGSFPPTMVPKIHSASHIWAIEHFSKLVRPLQFHYRLLQTEDLPEIRALHKEWSPLEYPESYFDSLMTTRTTLVAYLNPEEFGDMDTKLPILVGLITFSYEPMESNSHMNSLGIAELTHFVYIKTLGVVTQLRGFGVAKQLIQRCFDAARGSEHQPGHVCLHVPAHNVEAIPMYEYLGFQKSQILRNHYKMDGRLYDAYFYTCPLQEKNLSAN